ncbi:MAG: penicillin-binding protein activator LpoB [Planctomycetes bacterium]|nr:penicillin-binding protein activator LpoB [Planctomycetota bacterium]
MKLPLIAACLVLPAAALVVAGCGTSVQREDETAVIDLSGSWNDTDSRLVAEEMIKDSLQRPWAADFTAKTSRKPVVRVRRVLIRAEEVINPAIITDSIVQELVNSGRVRAVAEEALIDQARNERADQEKHASADSRKESFQELGADFVLTGTIESQLDQEGSKAVKYYKATFKLVDVTTQEIAWQRSKAVKKLVKK